MLLLHDIQFNLFIASLLRARLVHYNNYYNVVGIIITSNTGSWNGIRGGNSCLRDGFMSYQLMSVRLYESTLTRHIY